MGRHAERIRRFSRFYTRQLGLLGEGLLESPFPLPEARLIYEIAHHEQTTASQLAEELGLDPGYVSRLVRRLHDQGVVERTRSSTDGRVTELTLTERGNEEFARLNSASKAQVRALLDRLTVGERERLVGAMQTIEDLLEAPPEHRVPYILRPHQPGDIGWVVQRHGELYNREMGWGERFEALVAEIASRFISDFDPERERCWIAEKDGERVGSVFLVTKSKRVAQLRMLIVDPSARGLGIGRRLVRECTRFARDKGYRKIVLWTDDGLDAARRIYEAEGYVLTSEEPHSTFGHELIGQSWELEL